MADENEITVNAQPAKRNGDGYQGLSPLAAGLVWGGAATATMGPLGLLVGLGAGITAKRAKENYLDRQANYTAEYKGFQDEVDSEIRIADPDEKRLLEHSKRLSSEGWNRLAAGDPTGRDMISQANQLAQSVMQGDISNRKQQEAEKAGFMRQLVGTSANALRTEHQETLKKYEEIDKQVTEVLQLVAQPDFDPNKPFNKAVLADLISVGVNGLSKNDPDGFLESLPVAGPIIRGFYNDEKYNLSGEDFNRVAIALKKANEVYSENTMVRLGEQAQTLDQSAKQSGVIANDYSLGEYISGGANELRFTEIPKYTPPVPLSNSQKVQQRTNAAKQEISQWVDKKLGRKQARPTN